MHYTFLFPVIIISLILLLFLTYIDLKHRLLPNKYVFPLGLLGIFFHFLLHFAIFSPIDLLLGCLVGGGLLYGVRLVANHFHRFDTLGLGDVKLMGAFGLWLGVDGVLLAISLGAFFGVLHGLGYGLWLKVKTGTFPPLTSFSLPAGPGFIVGGLVIALYKFSGLFPLVPFHTTL